MIIATLALVFAQTAQVALPPRNALVERVSDGVKYLETKSPWYGVRYSEVIEPKETDIDRETVRNLLLGPDDLPGYVPYLGSVALNSPSLAEWSNHTRIILRNTSTRIQQNFRTHELVTVGSDESRPVSSRLLPMGEVTVYLTILPDKAAANRAFQGDGTGSAPRDPKTKDGPLPSGKPIGETHWFTVEPTVERIEFLLGRCVVDVFARGSQKLSRERLEKLARVYESRIQQDAILMKK